MLAAVLAVTVIAMAGVGYAVQYTATTTNTGNHMENTYLTLTQDGTAAYNSGSFLKDLYFDSVNITDKDTTTYTPVLTGKLDGNTYADYTAESVAAEDDVAKISNPLKLKLASSSETQPGTIGLLVTIKQTFELNDKMKFTMVLQGAGVAEYKTQTVDGKNVTGWYFPTLTVNPATGSEFDVVLLAQLKNPAQGLTTDISTGFPPFEGVDTCDFIFKAIATA